MNGDIPKSLSGIKPSTIKMPDVGVLQNLNHINSQMAVARQATFDEISEMHRKKNQQENQYKQDVLTVLRGDREKYWRHENPCYITPRQ